ncbi:MAG: hypothetical protein ACE5EZ_02130 [Thermodesulfobacteriota bacterium]
MRDVFGLEARGSGGLDWFKHHQIGKNRVLLREPEKCLECGHVFISLYPLGRCLDHDGLEEI